MIAAKTTRLRRKTIATRTTIADALLHRVDVTQDVQYALLGPKGLKARAVQKAIPAALARKGTLVLPVPKGLKAPWDLRV